MFPDRFFLRAGLYFNSLSAPLLKTKSRSPSSAMETKAKVVKVSDNWASEISTPSLFKVSKRNFPNGSSPTHPIKIPFPPNLEMAQATLAGAQPAFLVNSVALDRSLPCFSATKSINNSPMQYTFFMLFQNILRYIENYTVSKKL